jgi:hypothetical protein
MLTISDFVVNLREPAGNDDKLGVILPLKIESWRYLD